MVIKAAAALSDVSVKLLLLPHLMAQMSSIKFKGANMSSTGLEVFDETPHKTNLWLKEITQLLGVDRHGAYQVLRAVLHCLRDRLTTTEAANLGDQLPMLVRGIYYEAWHPAGKPEKIRSRDDFLHRMAMRMVTDQSVDNEKAARAVFQTLQNHVSAGEIRDVIEILPQEIRTLWPGYSDAPIN
jgi:uncharacterized protein (DUF2267 family)